MSHHDKIFTHLLCTVCNLPRVTQGRYDHQKSHKLKITCHACGDIIAKQEIKRKQSRVLPINKSTPTYISDISLLRQLNPKRTT